MKIYLFPFLMNLVGFMLIMHINDQAGRTHLSDMQLSILMGVQALVYMLSCSLAGRILRRSNARGILIASTIFMAVACMPAYLFTELPVLLVLLGGVGIAGAFFSNSFQTFMRADSPPGSLAASIGKYNFSWGSGIAMGFLLSGTIEDLLGRYCLAALSTAACMAILVMTIMHRQRRCTEVSADGHVESSPHGARPVDRRYVLVGWSMIFMACFIQRPLQTFIPKLSAQTGNGAVVAGTMIFCLMIAQSLASLLGHRMRGLLYRRTWVVVSNIIIVAGLGLLWLAGNAPLASMAIMLPLGCVFSFLFFSSIYYVSNDWASSRNVGVNEALVGLANVAAPFACEPVMRIFGWSEGFYPVTIAAVFVMLVVQMAWLSFGKPMTAPTPTEPAFALSEV